MNKFRSFSRPSLLTEDRKIYFIKDPVHGSVNFSADQYWIYSLINTLEFWRLHGMKQISLSYWNFPCSLHTRFVHSLGVYELCNRFIGSFIEKGYLDRKRDGVAINIALAAALLHDIGHGPLSHALEFAVPGFSHESMGIRIIRHKETKVNHILAQKSLADGFAENFYCEEIVKVLEKRSEHRWVMDLISSDFDVDRLDYLVRDSTFSGVSYGSHIDLDLFIKWAAIKDGRVVFISKIHNGLRHFVNCRRLMYEDLYGNGVSNGFEHMFIKACRLVREHIGDLTGCDCYRRCGFLFEKDQELWTVEEFVEVDDGVVLCFVRDALMKLHRSRFARKLLGNMFGVWVNAEGEYCERGEVGELVDVVDTEIMDLQIYKKGVVDKLRVRLWDIKAGEVKEMVLD